MLILKIRDLDGPLAKFEDNPHFTLFIALFANMKCLFEMDNNHAYMVKTD
uniref:Uncharacterized protein n=1 Tax=Setaria italica TaxID=4555 RepID=K3ZGI7_SETIT